MEVDRLRAAVLVVLVAGVAAAGCSSDRDDRPEATRGSDTTATSTTSTIADSTTTAVATTPSTAVTTSTEHGGPDDSRIVEPGDPTLAAGGLHSSVRCDESDPRIGLADLSWEPASSPGLHQRVQVTVSPEGFGPDSRFGPELAGDARATVWTELAGQAVHTWRVLTEQDGGWVPSPGAEFEGPLCAVDEQPDPEVLHSGE